VFRINILDGTKTSTSGRRYYFEGGPGLVGDPRVDPVLALAMYLMVRGDADQADGTTLKVGLVWWATPA